MFNKNTIMLTVLCILFTGLLSAQTALFEVKDTSGNTIFAVFEDGIIVKDSEGNDVFIAETDSVRVYLNEGTTDVGRGGFAIGSVASRSVEDYLFVAPDSSRVYVDGDGGFSIGDIGTGSAIDYLKLTPENYFIGHESGLLTSGLYNSFIGYQAGKTNWTGYNNIFLGYKSGMNNSTGNRNIFLGNESGISNISGFGNIFLGVYAGGSNQDGYRNIFMGFNAGYSNVSADDNIFIGGTSGYENTTGQYNTFLGSGSGHDNTSGNNNTFMGYQSGTSNTSGGANTFIGTYCGKSDSTASFNTYIGYNSALNKTIGNNNVFLGYSSGNSITSGENNVFVGRQSGGSKTSGGYNTMIGSLSGLNNGAGQYNVFLGYKSGLNEPDSHKLYIENSDTSDPLIYGEFDNDILVFNADVGINTNPRTDLEVLGTDGLRVTTGQHVNVFGEFKHAYSSGLIINANAGGGWADIRFQTDGTDRMFIESGGYVGIGTNAPAYPLHMGSGARCTIGGVWTNASSREYKENINNLTLDEAVETLKELNPVKFKYKNNLEEEHIGFIAEDVPDLVATSDRKGMSSMDVVAILTKVVQQQQELINNQNSKFEITDSELQEMKKMILELESKINLLNK